MPTLQDVLPDNPALQPRVFEHYTTSSCDFCSTYGPVNYGWVCEGCFPRHEELRIERARALEEQREVLRQQRLERLRQQAQQEVRARRQARIDLAKHGRRFGIELEVSVEGHADDIARELRRAGVEAYDDGYTHEVTDYWKVVPDGSVSCGWEVVSPPMTLERARREVPIVCGTLSDLGAEATTDCGLHVHHEVRDLSVPAFKRLVHRWNAAQPAIDGLVARHRRSDQCEWAEAHRSDELNALNGIESLAQIRELFMDRYRALNVQCFPKYGTVEVRQFQSTLDADEILAWVEFGQALIDDALRARTLDRGAVKSVIARTLVLHLPLKSVA